MKPKIAAGWVLIVIAAVFWGFAINGASVHGFFENELDVQLMILGGAIAMLAGVLWTPW